MQRLLTKKIADIILMFIFQSHFKGSGFFAKSISDLKSSLAGSLNLIA